MLYIPGIERKSFAIAASGCLVTAIVNQYCNLLLIFKIGGVFNHSLIASPLAGTVLKLLKLLKYLLCNKDAWKYAVY